MRAKKLIFALAAFVVLSVPAQAQAATAVPHWSVQTLATPTNFASGPVTEAARQPRYQAFITNSGGAQATNSPITITDTLPAGLEVAEVFLRPLGLGGVNLGEAPVCETTTDVSSEVSTVSCELSPASLPRPAETRLAPGDGLGLEVRVKVPATASGALHNRVEVEGGGAEGVAVAEGTNLASATPAKAGFEEFKSEVTGPDGRPASAADSHPYQQTTSFGVNLQATPASASAPFVAAEGDLKEIEVGLPAGLAANPTAFPRCRAQDFTTHFNVFSQVRGNFTASENRCPPGSVVGTAIIEQLEGSSFFAPAPIFNLVPPKGMPAQLGFEVVFGPVYINTRVRSDGDYGVSAYLKNTTEARRISAARFMIWGAPGAASHDAMRGICTGTWELCPLEGGEGEPAFLRMPSSCANPLTATMSFTTWAQPVTGAAASSVEAAPVGCAAPPFNPAIEAKPSTNAADSPTGLHFELALPQEEGEAVGALGEADLRDVSVALPGGLVVNPASADGRSACSPGQVGLATPTGQQSPIHFNLAPATCPAAAKIGTVEADVPALDHPLQGSVYLAAQEDNPFNSLLALYIVFEDEQTGVVVKLAAKVTADPKTGQLKTTVSENPQVPIEDFKFDFFEGARAPLRTPATCGTYTTNTEMTPWTAPEGASAFPSDSFAIDHGPQGPCPDGALAPKLDAGLANPSAGTYSPFSLRVSREDGTGEFAGLTTTPPLGFSAKLAGIPYCSQAGIDQAVGREHPGGGQQEIAQPSCPSSSKVGTITTGAGAGPDPFFVSGSLYLAGPYKGAPLSLVAVIPAVAGPFDLGTVVNRVATYVDRETAQIKAVADPLPTILSGIPVDARDIRVNLDRPDFALAPTSCEPKSVGATLQGTQGQSATVSQRFQVGGCEALKFKPSVSLNLKGGTKRSDHPALKAVVTYPQKGGYANTAKASVALPHSEFLEQAHIRTICTRVQFAAEACPKGAIYGNAKAWTPLLDKPLHGPVYLVGGFGYKLPALVAELNGQIRVLLKPDHGNPRQGHIDVSDSSCKKSWSHSFCSRVLNSLHFKFERAGRRAAAETASARTSASSDLVNAGKKKGKKGKKGSGVGLSGQTKRGGHPALTATLTMKTGEANISRVAVGLPHSEFLDQGHIKTICTRVQFNEGVEQGGVPGAHCPKNSIYGYARAKTPLLEKPLEGPAYLRSSSHTLPDLVLALSGQINIVLDGRIDSHNGGIRTTFEGVPDAPVSKFTLEMQGGKKGLLENSTDICVGTHRATFKAIGQNGKLLENLVPLKPQCKGQKKSKKKKNKGHGTKSKSHKTSGSKGAKKSSFREISWFQGW